MKCRVFQVFVLFVSAMLITSCYKLVQVDPQNSAPLGYSDMGQLKYANKSIHVEGWALDETDVTVSNVYVYIDRLCLGIASLNIKRQDVAAVYGEKFVQTGWGANLEVELTKGSHQFYAIAVDKKGAAYKLLPSNGNDFFEVQ